MNFTDLASYPMVADMDCSPTNDTFSYPDAFDKAYLVDASTARSDYAVDSLFDTNSFFEQQLHTFEPPAAYASKAQSLFAAASISTMPNVPAGSNAWTANSSPLFTRPSNLNSAFATSPSFDNVHDSFDVAEAPARNSSPTPSLCGDGPQPQNSGSPPLSPCSLKRESPEEAADLEEAPAPKRSQRRRGRPRLDRNSTDSTNSSTSSTARATHRLPHNQVERKYREGLNAELERLRKAVPTLIQSDPRDVTSPKPSKATILASAIEYIKKIEDERDQLRDENERLKGAKPGARNR